MEVSMKLLAYPTDINKTRIVKIENIREETPNTKSFAFYDESCGQAKPGQFIMLWIPRVDEIPISLSTIDKTGLTEITVEKVGDATTILHSKRVNDSIGIRGPYGNGFQLIRGNVMLVAGGTGIASLAPLVESLKKIKAKITLIMGARTREDLLFLERTKNLSIRVGNRLIVTTDDGSYGIKGLAIDPVEELLKEEKFDMIYACGPELLTRKVFDLAEKHKTSVQVNLERIVRCSVGLCGSCVIGGFRICRDGPVLNSQQLEKISDGFGRHKLDFCGKKINF